MTNKASIIHQLLHHPCNMLRLLPLLFLAALPISAGDVLLTQSSRGTIHRWVTIPATLRPDQQVTLHAKVAGHLKSISVDVGDAVAAGQSLAILEVPEIEADMISARTAKEVAELSYNRLVVASEKASGVVLPQVLDEAQGRLKIAESALKRQEILLSYATLTAPFKGTITARYADHGAYIPAGGTDQQGAVVSLADTAKMRACISVPEQEAKFIKSSTLANIITSATAKPLEAKVSRVSNTLDTNSATMTVEVDLPNSDNALIAGAYVKAMLAAETHPNALLIPVSAILAEKVSSSVFVYREGKAVKTPIVVGFNDGKNAEVISGVSGDEALILLTGLTLTDGQSVTTALVK
jgi:RND family efflux transporter MFP subunit